MLHEGKPQIARLALLAKSQVSRNRGMTDYESLCWSKRADPTTRLASGLANQVTQLQIAITASIIFAMPLAATRFSEECLGAGNCKSAC